MSDDQHRLYEYAAENRTRIEAQGSELERVRSKVHNLEGELAALRYLGRKVDELARGLHDVAGELQRLGGQTVPRPRAAAYSAAASWLAAIIALVALIVALEH